jgi:hypothetical protein
MGGRRNIVSFSLLTFILDGYSYIHPAAIKGVTQGNLIRLGVLWGKGANGYGQGQFEADWGCHSTKHIQLMHDRLCKKLGADRFGPFDSLSLLIGDRNARIVSVTKDYACRPPPTS